MMDSDFNLCVDRHIKMVYRIAFHYFGKREEAEDVTQDVFLKLYASDFTLEKEEEIKAWLIRVTWNTCHSVFRNPFVKKRSDLEEYEWEQISDDDSGAQDFITQKTVLDAVMLLPEKYRILIYLYYYEEYSCRRISEILQIKETTVQTRLSRARGKLKGMLAKSFPEKGVFHE